MQSLNADNLQIPRATFDAVVHRGERVRIERDDGAAIYLVGETDFRAVETREDQFDADEARHAIARHEAPGGRTIRLDDLSDRLRVDRPDRP
jgi:hypothetical protein